MRKQALLMTPLVLVLAACAGRGASAPPETSSTLTSAPTVVAAPSPPLDCTTFFSRDGFFLTPDDATGLDTKTLFPAAGSNSCTWIATIWESVTLVVVPQVDRAVPVSTCSVSDEGGGDHVSCRFDASANGYRLSGYLGGPQAATAAEVLASTKPIVAAFDDAASAAVPGRGPESRAVPIDCGAIDRSGSVFEQRDANGTLAMVGAGPSLPRSALFRLAGAVECEANDVRVEVVPGLADPAGTVTELGAETVAVPDTQAARFDGDVPAEYGANIYLAVGHDLVHISQGSKSRATQLALCAAVIAALAR